MTEMRGVFTDGVVCIGNGALEWAFILDWTTEMYFFVKPNFFLHFSPVALFFIKKPSKLECWFFS